MFEKIDLSRKLEKEEFKKIAPLLRERLGELQRKARDAGIPVLVLFEGWDASGKGTLMNELILPLDPRGFRVHYVHSDEDNPLERFWPPMRGFWEITPARGQIGIYSRSWYRLVTDHPDADKNGELYENISSFERQLAQDGNLIIKFFLHISRKEQRRRLRKLDEKKSRSRRVSEKEWEQNEHYKEAALLIENIIQNTDRAYAPWTIVEAEDRRYASIKILTTVIRGIEKALEMKALKIRTGVSEDAGDANTASEAEGQTAGLTSSPLEPSVLKNLDLSKHMSDKKYGEERPELQKRLRDLQYRLYAVRRPMVVVFEGPDAAGKGGCIKSFTQKLDPRGYQVSPTASPNDWQRAHHYLWRFWNAFPKAGHIGIYDRSWYGRVLVERVEGFATEFEWRRAYGEINEMENQWFRYGCIILKFWLQIGSDEQLTRFKERQENPEKTWKITDEDWRNREKWPLYEEAAEEMMLRTSTAFAPWTIVEANDKQFARIKVLRETVSAAEKALGL